MDWLEINDQELNLPHSPRHIVFPNEPSSSTASPLPKAIHLLYAPTQSILLNIAPAAKPPLSISEISSDSVFPPAGTTSSTGDVSSSLAQGQAQTSTAGALTTGVGGALSGLGGYVGLGGKAVVPVGTRIGGGEVLLARDGELKPASCIREVSLMIRSWCLLLARRQFYQKSIPSMAGTTRSSR